MVRLCLPVLLQLTVMMETLPMEMDVAQLVLWNLNGHVQEEMQVQQALVLIFVVMVL